MKYPYQSNLKKKIAHEILRENLSVVKNSSGEILKEPLKKVPHKQVIKYNFVKPNIEIIGEVEKRVGRDILYLLRLSMSTGSDGSVNPKCLCKLLHHDNISKKMSKFVECGLVKKITKKRKTKYYINPYFCHRTNDVWADLADHFTPITNPECK